MKRVCVVFSFVFLIGCIFAQNVGINANGAIPNAAAMLDINISSLSTKKGLLIPRLTLEERGAMSPLPAAAQGLLVYQTNGLEGFYYNTSTTTTPNWIYLYSSNAGIWLSKGNSGTNPSSAAIGATVNNDFIGTTDTKDLVLASNNYERMRISSQGHVLIGTSASVANAKLSVRDGHIQVSQSTAPTITVSTNAGTGATALLTSKSNDVVGNIVFTSGSGAISPGSQCIVTFFKPYTSPPIVSLTPTNAYTSGSTALALEIFPVTTTTGFTITFGRSPNPISVVYEWNYMVIEP